MDAKLKNKFFVYFIGIGGIGMSALARWYLSHGYAVEGSDIIKTDTTEELKKDGIKIKIGQHNAKNIRKTISKIIYNQAIPKDNPELETAAKLGIPCQSYPEALGELTKIYKTIAIAGAHGKSTTTALIALMLQKAGFDPTVIVGTKLKEFGNKNFKNGKSEYLVIEADEYKAAFLNYSPYAAIVTNIDREHLDFYQNLSNIKKTFRQFLNKVHPYGLITLNKDNRHLLSLKSAIKHPVVWYTLNSDEAKIIRKILKIPGEHNVSNAVGAYNLAMALGIKKSKILKAISEFNGSWRRSEYKGKYLKAKVYDDYAHHPTEIKATLSGFKRKFPQCKIICVFQPHQTERLKLLFNDFINSLNIGDELILLNIYKVAGREAQNAEVNSEILKNKMESAKNKKVSLVNNIKELKSALKKSVSTNSIIIMMGAGDINEWTKRLIK